MMSNDPTVAHSGGARVDAVARVFGVGILVIVLVMLGRVVQLQVSPPAPLRAMMGDRTSTIVEPGRRGDLLDRRGRLLAASRFGYRVFVDPTKFKSPPDASILALADAMGLPVETVGKPILDAMVHNERAKELKERQEESPPLRRYVPIGGILDDARVDLFKNLKIDGVHLEARSVRESAAGEEVAAILGKVGTDQVGLMGAEKLKNENVKPVAGHLTYVRDAGSRALWVNPGGYVAPQRGQDVRLSIDLEIQRIALEELERGVDAVQAQGGRIVVMDPLTGEIVAMADVMRNRPDAVAYDWKTLIQKDKAFGNGPWGPRYITINPDPGRGIHPALGRNRCIEDIYEPGSTFKPFMWSAVTELGLATPEEIFDTGHGVYQTPYGRTIKDVVKMPSQSWADVLVNSSNIGMTKGTARMSFGQMHDAVIKFGFGVRTGVGLPGEAVGLVTPLARWSNYSQTSVAMGHEVAVTPLQMVRAFSVFARTGELAGTMAPIRLDGAGESTPEVHVTKRIVPAEIADLARRTMRGVTAKLDRRLAQEHPPQTGWRYELFGKSGTAEIPMTSPPQGSKKPKGSDGYFRGQYNSSFIAGGPFENPRLVCVAVIDDPSPKTVRERLHYGSLTAGPVVRRTLDRALAYLGVPASLTPEGDGTVVHAE